MFIHQQCSSSTMFIINNVHHQQCPSTMFINYVHEQCPSTMSINNVQQQCSPTMFINNVHQQCPSTMCRSFFLRPLNAEIERLTLLFSSLFPLWCLRFSCSLCHRTSPHFKPPHSPRFLNEASFYVALKLMAQVQNHQTLGKRHTHTSFNRAMCNVLTPLDLTPCNTDIRALNNDPSIQCPTFTAVRAIDVDATCWLHS